MTKGLPPPKLPRLRRLSDDEIELWARVAESVTPLPGSSLPERASAPPPEVAAKPVGTLPAASLVPRAKRVAPPSLAPFERKLKQKLSRGRMTADAAIDLHGLRQAEAYGALRHFLEQGQATGARVVLVVTGKGGRGGDPFGIAGGEVGVLKRSVPHWLALPEFRTLVAAYEEAGRPHGGAGALYVRLRRKGL